MYVRILSGILEEGNARQDRQVKRFGVAVSTITIADEDRSILNVCEDFIGYFRGRNCPPNRFTLRRGFRDI